METINIIVTTVFELVKAVLSPLDHLDTFIDGISTALKGSSELSSTTEVPDDLAK